MSRVNAGLLLLNTVLLFAALWMAGQRVVRQPPPAVQTWLEAGR